MLARQNTKQSMQHRTSCLAVGLSSACLLFWKHCVHYRKAKLTDTPRCDDDFGNDDEDVNGSGNVLCPAFSMEKTSRFDVEDGEMNAF